METVFTPWLSLFGGALIGLASTMLMVFRGRVFGATGVLAGFMVPSSSGDWAWRATLLLGMISGPAAYLLMTGNTPDIQVPVSTAMMIGGGIVVGVGVTYGSGCTSGHGVCGLARLSPRSLVATLIFMGFTALTVFVVRHVIGG